MAATLTVTPDPANGRVQIAWTGATIGDRITRDGQPVRYPPITSAAGIVFDYEAQPGIEHTYGLSGGTATATLPAPAGCDGAFLVHPLDPSLTLKVKVRDDNPNRWTSPGTLHEVMGRRDPIVTHTVRTYHSGELVFWTPYAQEQAVIDLFADGTPILLNPPACCPLRRVWMWAPDIERDKINVDGGSGLWWRFSYTRVGEPGGFITRPDHVANTWAGVVAEPSEPTWTALVANHATWTDVVTTIHPHGATP
jgi:hypothetical protein